MVLLDTTVLLYATGSDHPLRDSCRRLVDALADTRLRATTTPEVIRESTHVRARLRGRAEAVHVATVFADLLAPLLPVAEPTLHRGLGTYAFAGVPGLRHVLPTDDGIGSLLG